jgi:hypothetical protein
VRLQLGVPQPRCGARRARPHVPPGRVAPGGRARIAALPAEREGVQQRLGRLCGAVGAGQTGPCGAEEARARAGARHRGIERRRRQQRGREALVRRGTDVCAARAGGSAARQVGFSMRRYGKRRLAHRRAEGGRCVERRLRREASCRSGARPGGRRTRSSAREHQQCIAPRDASKQQRPSSKNPPRLPAHAACNLNGSKMCLTAAAVCWLCPAMHLAHGRRVEQRRASGGALPAPAPAPHAHVTEPAVCALIRTLPSRLVAAPGCFSTPTSEHRLSRHEQRAASVSTSKARANPSSFGRPPPPQPQTAAMRVRHRPSAASASARCSRVAEPAERSRLRSGASIALAWPAAPAAAAAGSAWGQGQVKVVLTLGAAG